MAAVGTVTMLVVAIATCSAWALAAALVLLGYAAAWRRGT